MDNYPESLKPRFDAGGGVEEPYEEWWPKVHAHFPNVPENVARYWLHEHWSHSPYSFLRSKDYRFDLLSWPSQSYSKSDQHGIGSLRIIRSASNTVTIS
jgi:hypothetical protein